jgi:hypothetical protein
VRLLIYSCGNKVEPLLVSAQIGAEEDRLRFAKREEFGFQG